METVDAALRKSAEDTGLATNFPTSVSLMPPDVASVESSPGMTRPPEFHAPQGFWGATAQPQSTVPPPKPVVENRRSSISAADEPLSGYALRKAMERREAEREQERRAAEEERQNEERREEMRQLSRNNDIATYRISGDGYRRTTVREKATFMLEALDADGDRVYRGGDPIFVSIQGVTRARARIDDHDDGTYTVRWRPIQSGPYKIVVSNLGKPLPGSPFMCIASTPEPFAPECQVTGGALNKCMARETQNFAVSFRDQLGVVTHAVDLDVFVEPVPEQSPQANEAPSPSPDKSVRRYMPSPLTARRGPVQ